MKQNLFQKIIFIPTNIISFLNMILGIPIIIILLYLLFDRIWIICILPIWIIIDIYKHFWATKNGGKAQMPVYKFEEKL